MNAEVLREAATAIRDEWGDRGDPGTAWHQVVAFHLAVAEWLEANAALIDSGVPALERTSLAVAHAYLGVTA